MPGTTRAEQVGVEVGHGLVPMPHTPSPLRQTLSGSGVRVHPAHKPTEAYKPLQSHHREEAPCCANTSVRSISGCLWEERLGGNVLYPDSGVSDAGSLKRMRRLVILVQVRQALPRAGFCLDPGSYMPGEPEGRDAVDGRRE